jgi:hypothetical protein
MKEWIDLCPPNVVVVFKIPMGVEPNVGITPLAPAMFMVVLHRVDVRVGDVFIHIEVEGVVDAACKNCQRRIVICM